MPPLPASFLVEVNFDPYGGGAYQDVSAYVRSGSISRGSSRDDGLVPPRYEAGTATVELSNRDARFDPTNLSGPYVASGVSQVVPLQPKLRIKAGGNFLFHGFVESWTNDYLVSGKDAVCVVRAVDGAKILNTFNGIGSASQGAGETAGARIARILDNWGGFPDRAISASGYTETLVATTLTGNPWSEMQLVADTEIAELYFDGNGFLVFRNRRAWMTEARSINPQATFGDSGSELRYEQLDLQTDDVQIRNRIIISTPAGGSATAQDNASIAKFFIREHERTDLLAQDAGAVWADSHARFLLGILSGADPRVEELVVNPNRDPTPLYAQVLVRELGDRIKVLARPVGRAADPITREVYIRGIAHEFTPSSWRTTWALQDAARFNFGVYDAAGDQARYDFAKYS